VGERKTKKQLVIVTFEKAKTTKYGYHDTRNFFDLIDAITSNNIHMQ